MPRTHAVIASPIGPLTAVREDGVLVGLTMGPADTDGLGPRDDAAFADVRAQLDEYFAGTRTSFDLPVRASGNALQLAVWELIAAIPYGATRSYGDLARDLGDRTLAQAVGTACGRNPLPVVVPCHRVVGADGSLVGFGGGLARKRFLLDLEHRDERLF
ncbi:MAG TPA: methylated-DNA--[protein]-cysteine S-methyltransferase [Blastococcus sp.]|nr:methylated-DNA--[protein]-cysteine S-methyltransferase [Blastococcus sp.]